MASSAEVTGLSARGTIGRAAVRRIQPQEPSVSPSLHPDRSLTSLIESQVIPRLMLAHGFGVQACTQLAAAPIGQADVDLLVPLTLSCDAGEVLAQVERVIARGLSIECVMVELLAPTARRLGILWEEDRCDFVEVTMGLWRLQEVVRELSARFAPPCARLGGRLPRTALFLALPGDQHDFGAAMVAEVFHRGGWDVDTAPGADMTELLAEVGRHHYDIVGLTVSCDCPSTRLRSTILTVRSVSRNAGVRVLVGGRIFNEDPGLAERVGADGTASDAVKALAVAEALLDAVTVGAAASI